MDNIFRHKINNEELIFNDIIYIDKNGDDLHGNGKKDSPFFTIKKALETVKQDNTAIIINPGEYNWRVNDYENNDKFSLFTSLNNSVNFIGYNDKTVINTKFNKPNCNLIKCGKSNLNIYNLVVKVDCEYNGENKISNNFICGNDNKIENIKTNIYNCVLQFKASQNCKGLFYNNKDGNCNMYNCLIDFGEVINSWSGYKDPQPGPEIKEDEKIKNRLKLYNCLIKNIYDWRSNTGGTDTPYIDCINCIKGNDNCYNEHDTMTNKNIKIEDIVVDDRYYPVNTEIWKNFSIDIKNSDNTLGNVGVYGGRYQWDNIEIKKSDIKIETVNKIIDKKEDYTFKFSISPAYINNCIEQEMANQISNDVNKNIFYNYLFIKTDWKNVNEINLF